VAEWIGKQAWGGRRKAKRQFGLSWYLEISMHALITGGAGFIGSFLTERLLSEGYTVTIFDNLTPQVHPDGLPADLPTAAERVIGDIRDPAALGSALAHADLVVHCAAAVGVGQSMYQVHHYVDVNVAGTANLLQLIIDSKRSPQKLIVLTSMTGYGEGLYRRPSNGSLLRVAARSEMDVQLHGWEPVCPQTGEALVSAPTPEDAALQAHNVYALTKRYQEELAFSLGRTYQFPVVCLRLFNVYGPRQSLSNPYTGVLAIFLSRLLAGQRPVVYEDGRQTRDFVSVHDVVSAVIRALACSQADGQMLNIGSGVPRQIADCAYQLAHLLGRDDLAPKITGQFRNGDIRHCTADLTRAQQVLGYTPQVGWDEGLHELVAWAAHAPSVDRFLDADAELQQRQLIQPLV
jgi:dTDP-L-rhamnose 4-epimerase